MAGSFLNNLNSGLDSKMLAALAAGVGAPRIDGGFNAGAVAQNVQRALQQRAMADKEKSALDLAAKQRQQDVDFRNRKQREVERPKPYNLGGNRMSGKNALVASSPTKPNAGKMISVQLPGGKVVGGRVSFDGKDPVIQIQDPKTLKWVQAPPGAQSFTKSLQAGNVGDLTGLNKKAVSDLSEAAFDYGHNISSMASLLGRLNKSPGALGVRGALGEKIGGYAGQISKGFGDQVTEGITGAKVKDVTQARIDAQSIVAQQISAITGDTSGRFTTKEQAIARQITRLMEVDASPEQINASLEQLMTIQVMSQERDSLKLGKPPSVDFTNRDSVEAFKRRLQKLGFSREGIIDAASRLKLMHGEMPGG